MWSDVSKFDKEDVVHIYNGILAIKKNEIMPFAAIPLQGIYPEKTKSLTWKDTCTPMFIAALCTIAKTWKQPKCPSTEEWIKKMWYTHTHTIEYYSAIKRMK